MNFRLFWSAAKYGGTKIAIKRFFPRSKASYCVAGAMRAKNEQALYQNTAHYGSPSPRVIYWPVFFPILCSETFEKRKHVQNLQMSKGSTKKLLFKFVLFDVGNFW